jgi:hypothetical protein
MRKGDMLSGATAVSIRNMAIQPVHYHPRRRKFAKW